MHSISPCFVQTLKVFVFISIPLLSSQSVDSESHVGDLIIVYKSPEHNNCEICDSQAHDEDVGSESVQDTSAVSMKCKHCLQSTYISNNH